jgi:hypothetical protein
MFSHNSEEQRGSSLGSLNETAIHFSEKASTERKTLTWYPPIRLALVVSAIAGAGMLPSAVYADVITVQAATFEVTAAGGIPILSPGTVSGFGCNPNPVEGGCESSKASIAYNNGTVAGANSGMTSGGIAVANASGFGSATFFFDVLGPSNVLVPLIITASGSTSASGPEAVDQVQVSFAGGQFYACSGTGPEVAACGSASSSFSGSKSFSLESNLLSDVEVTISGSSTGGTGGFSGMVDPMITIDPNFAIANEFSLLFSPGVNPVPEPSGLTLALVLLALLSAMAAIKEIKARSTNQCPRPAVPDVTSFQPDSGSITPDHHNTVLSSIIWALLRHFSVRRSHNYVSARAKSTRLPSHGAQPAVLLGRAPHLR